MTMLFGTQAQNATAAYGRKPARVETCFAPDPEYGYTRVPVRWLRIDFEPGAVLRLSGTGSGTGAGTGAGAQARVLPEAGCRVDATKGEDVLMLEFTRPGQWVVEPADGGPRTLIFVDPAGAWPVPAWSRPAAEFGIRPNVQGAQTEQINAALLALEHEGGGVLVFGPGLYLTGTVVLRSNVTLYLHAGAVLQATDDPAAFPVEPEDAINRELPPSLIPGARRRLILGECVRGAAILGRGVICGDGSAMRRKYHQPRLSTNLVRLVNCTDVTIEGVVLRDSEFWSVHVLHCRDVAFRWVKWLNEIPPRGWDAFRRPGSESVWNNADGLNPDSSQGVLAEDCFFHTGDDCVPVKNTSTWLGKLADVRDVVVRRCVMITPVTALKLGTETLGEAMENIIFEDIEIVACSRALAIDLKDGVSVRGVVFRRVRVHRCNRPFDFWILTREDRAGQERFSRLSGVRLENVDFCQVGVEGRNGESHVLGRDAEHGVEDITFRHVTIEGAPLRALEGPAFETNAFATKLRFE